MRTLLLLLTTVTLRADDADAILRRMADAVKENGKLARQYTYLEDQTWFHEDKHGQMQKDRSASYEVIFIEGTKYAKLISRNDKPLSKKEAAQVEKDMQATAEEWRRKHPPTPPGGVLNIGRVHFDLGSYEELVTLFDNRVTGEEEVNGRMAWAVESTPRADYTPANPHEKDVRAFRKKLWIDEHDNIPVRVILTVGDDGLHSPNGEVLGSPGSTITLESAKINDEVWQQVSIVLDLHKPAGKSDAHLRTEHHQSRFQKFNVESTITVEPPK